jgi:flavodoxin
MKKCLIAFYSRKGNNYVGGKIMSLSIGNTEVIAQKIHALTSGELFEIKTVKPYPEDYTETTEVSRNELKNKARPLLSATVSNMDSYDTIYLGYPNWWGTMPMAVFTFLETYNFAGKTIVPFCTHEGSGLSNSERDIKHLCKDSKVLSAIAIRGSLVSKADNEVKIWLKNNQLI